MSDMNLRFFLLQMPQNATPASLETSSSTESSLVPRATQTDMGNQLLPGHYLSGARSASSGVSPIGQEEVRGKIRENMGKLEEITVVTHIFMVVQSTNLGQLGVMGNDESL